MNRRNEERRNKKGKRDKEREIELKSVQWRRTNDNWKNKGVEQGAKVGRREDKEENWREEKGEQGRKKK